MPVHILKKFFRWTRWTRGKRSFVPSTATPFVALYPFLPVKLPHNIVTLALPALQTTDAFTTLPGSIRITEQINTRVTRAGNIRVTRDFTITSRPELTVLKLPSSVISLSVPNPKGNRGSRENTWSKRK